MTATSFSAAEWLRYSRHIQLPQIGARGQKKLKDATVLVIGAGGLGSPVLYYLAAAGIGNITLVDSDVVELTNLQRQILYSHNDIGKAKAEVAKSRLIALNPTIVVHAINQNFTEENAEALVSDAHIVLDCTDNFSTRYLINDVCYRHNVPWVYGSIHQFTGQCAMFLPEGPCFRCLFPEFPENILDCNAAGVLGVLPGLVGCMQANEALKYLCGLTTPLANHLLLFDAINLTQRKIQLTHNPNCTCCGKNRNEEENASFYRETQCSIHPDETEIEPATYIEEQDKLNFVLLDVRTDAERNGFNIGGQHIPLSKLELALDALDKSKTYLCYCQSGKRSMSACEILNSKGYSSHSLAGGLMKYLQVQLKKMSSSN